MKNENYIWGFHSLEACLENYPDLIVDIFLLQDFESDEISRIKSLIDSQGLKFQKQKNFPLEVKEKRHQGMCARLKNFPFQFLNQAQDDLTEAITHQGQWMLLEGIEDPRNYGAILRSAAAFGVKGVFVADKKQAPLSGVVAQASAGNVFRLPIYVCKNLGQVFELKEKANADLKIFALDMKGLRLGQLKKNLNKNSTVIWCLGSEGEGLSDKLLKQATERVSIEMMDRVESLNVSVAASLAAYAYYESTLQ